VSGEALQPTTETVVARLNRLSALATAVCTTVVLVAMTYLSQSHVNEVSDLPEYALAGILFLEGRGAELYDVRQISAAREQMFPEVRHREFGFLGPPPSLPIMAPLALCPWPILTVLWILILSASAVGSYVICLRLFGSFGFIGNLFWWSGLMLSGPLFEALHIGQMSPLFLFALTAWAKAMRSGMVVPAAFALAFFVLKPHLAVPLGLFLLGAGRYRAVTVTCAIVAALGLIALAVDGPSVYVAYAKLMSELGSNTAPIQPELCATVLGQLMRMPGMDNTQAELVARLVAVFAWIGCFLWGRVMKQSPGWLDAGLIVVVPLTLVTSLHSHFYDVLLLLPSLMACFRTKWAGSSPLVLRVAIVIGLALFTIPIYALIHYQYLLKGGVINPYFLALFAYAIWVAAAAWKFREDFR